MEISKELKLEAFKQACEHYPDNTPNVTQNELDALRMGFQVGWILHQKELMPNYPGVTALEKSLDYATYIYNSKLSHDCKHYRDVKDDEWTHPYFTCNDLSKAFEAGYETKFEEENE